MSGVPVSRHEVRGRRDWLEGAGKPFVGVLNAGEVVQDPLFDTQGAPCDRIAGTDRDELKAPERAGRAERRPVSVRERSEREAERRLRSPRVSLSRRARGGELRVEL